MLVDRAQAVMPGSPSAHLHLNFHRREVELVVEDGEGLWFQLVEGEGLLHRIAARVHISLRPHQQDLFAADAAFADEAPEFLGPRRKAVHVGDDIGRHEADVVPVQRILHARISEADPDLHAAS
jgi:hypothetical protein